MLRIALAVVVLGAAIGEARAEPVAWSSPDGGFHLTLPENWVSRRSDAMLHIAPPEISEAQRINNRCEVQVAMSGNQPGITQGMVNDSGISMTEADAQAEIGAPTSRYSNNLVQDVRVISYEAQLTGGDGSSALLMQRTFLLLRGETLTSYRVACMATQDVGDAIRSQMRALLTSLSF